MGFFPTLPNNTQRITILGRTGSGKTRAGVFHLSRQNIDKQPWIVIDFKRDDLINRIENARELHPEKKLPKEAGIYIMHAFPEDAEPGGAIPKLFRNIWQREKIGVFADETFMLGRTGDMPEFEALLTQGRSKKIPMIMCTQRPVWMSKFCVTEADYIQFFQMNDIRDIKTVSGFFPRGVDLEKRIPKYHSQYADISADTVSLLGPVPRDEQLLEYIDGKTKRKIKWF